MSVAEDSADDQDGHQLPAVEDWPKGYGEASWWPFITAIGAVCIYVSAALFVLSTGDDPLVPTMAGVVVAIVAAVFFLGGLYGWVYHAFVVNFWERGTNHHSARELKFGLLLFLGTEVATFGAGFVYYFVVRGGAAWSQELLPESGVLGVIVFANTAILIISSITLHYGHKALRNGNRQRYIRLLGTTLLLGLIFIAGQMYEYYEFIVVHGYTVLEGAYASAFFGLTGLHGLHVSLGALLLGIVFVRSLYGQYSAERHTSVSTVSMYWHFVDVVWVFLVLVLYIGAAVG